MVNQASGVNFSFGNLIEQLGYLRDKGNHKKIELSNGVTRPPFNDGD
jgi:hypothetical protein